MISKQENVVLDVLSFTFQPTRALFIPRAWQSMWCKVRSGYLRIISTSLPERIPIITKGWAIVLQKMSS